MNTPLTIWREFNVVIDKESSLIHSTIVKVVLKVVVFSLFLRFHKYCLIFTPSSHRLHTVFTRLCIACPCHQGVYCLPFPVLRVYSFYPPVFWKAYYLFNDQRTWCVGSSELEKFRLAWCDVMLGFMIK